MKLRLVAVVLATSAGAAAQAGSAGIELSSSARAGTGPVLLGHLARVTSDDLALAQRLVSLPVGAPPAAGQSRWMTRESLERWVQRREASTLKWSGASTAEVVVPAQDVPAEQLASVAGSALPKPEHWQARPYALRSVRVPAGDLALRARPPVGTDARVVTVWVDVLVDGHPVRSLGVPMEQVSPGHAETRSRRAASAEEPLVRRGEWAQLRSGAGLVAVDARVEVLQDGRRGQKVWVRPASGGGTLAALVRGAGELEVAR